MWPVKKFVIGACEAKTKLPELLRQVESGKSFTITYRGQAIAYLVPSSGARAKIKAAAVEQLKAFMRTDPVRSPRGINGVNVKQLVKEGRA
ncbi:MAG: type II toxin-antitoxin system prevent-host-death family antitoxin [Pseudomonadota bacterium]